MNCKKCGYPLFSNDKVCKRCGEEVIRESDIPEVTEEKKEEVPVAPVNPEGPIVDPTAPIADPTKPKEVPANLPQLAEIPGAKPMPPKPEVKEEVKEEVKQEVVDPATAAIPDPTKEAIPEVPANQETPKEEVKEEVQEVKQEINTGAIPDPTKPAPAPEVTENKEEVKEVSLPQVNNGPIEPVVENNGMTLPDVDAKKNSTEVDYDKIDGPKSLSNAMTMMGAPKQEEAIPEFNYESQGEVKETATIPEVNEKKDEGPKIENVNQGLPTLPNDRKSTSSVVIPTKPQPINNNVDNNTNNNMNNNVQTQEMNNYQQQMNNYDESMNNEPMDQNNQVFVEEKKKKKSPIIIILVLLILGVGGYFGYKYLVNNGIIGGKAKTIDVEFNSYQFKVPEKYKTQNNTNSLVIYDDTNILAVAFINGSYSEFSQALTLENFRALGHEATYLGEKEKDSHKYHLFKVVVEGKNAYIGYIASGDMKIICFSVEPKTGTTLPSDDYLNDAIDIAISAKYNGSSNVETENKEANDTSITTASQAVIGEEKNTGDISDEPVYEETYVNVTLNEINE